jgi:hypothetical protein
MIRISWVFEGMGGESAVVEDVDAAASALAGAVRAAYAREDTGTLAHILTTVVAPLRASLVTDGRYAVERGHTWSSGLGGVSVTLSPT